MKRIFTYITALLFVFMVLPVKSQNVMFNAFFDSLYTDTKEMRIGEHAKFILELNVDSGYNVELQVPEKLTADIEVLEKKDYRSTDAQGRETYRSECIITSFIDSMQVIPPVLATVNDDVYYTNATNLIVNTVPIDTVNLKNIKGVRPVWDVNLTWDDYRDTVHLSFLLLVFVALLIWIIVRLINNKPVIRIVKIKPREPSHFTALHKIDEIKGDDTLVGDGSVKDYYTRLTDTLREYMHNRYKFNAAEMTTDEIIENLLRFNDKEAINEVKEILQVADLVKFAKMVPSQNENARNMLNAIDFVNATKDVEEENLKPVEQKIVNERSRTEKYILIASIAIVFAVVVAVSALLIIDLGNMLG